MRAPLAAAVAALVGLCPARASGDVDPLALSRPSVRVYSEADGLPQGTIHAIAVDRDGFLWVGTQDGAARFNGRGWATLDMPGKSISNFVRALLPSRDGSLWFGREEGGLVRLREGMATVFEWAGGVPMSRVNDLLETGDGHIWAAIHGGGVARYTNTGFLPLSEGLPDLHVWSLLEAHGADGRRRLLAACEGGVAELEPGGRWKPVDLGAPLAGVSVSALLETGEGTGRTLWVGTFGAGLFRVRGRAVKRIGPEDGLAGSLVTSLAATTQPDGASQVWVGTRDAGVYRLAGDTFERVPLGTAAGEVYSLAGGVGSDPETLWVGTRSSGLARVRNAAWASFDRATGLPGDEVLCFLEAPGPRGREAVWIGTNEGIAIVENGRLALHGPETGLPDLSVRSLAEFASERGRSEVWASFVGGGLFRFDGTRWRPVESRPAFRSDDAGVLLADRDDAGRPQLWAGTEKSGLGLLSRGRWSALSVADGLPSDSILSLLVTRGARGKTLWVGTRGGGLAEVVAGRVVAVHDRKSGFPNNNVLSLAEVTGPDGRKELWAGTRGGVARRSVDSVGPWSVLSEATVPSLPNDDVLSIAQGPGGDVYLGTNRGVARLAAPGPEGALPEAVAYGTNDGLPSAACNQGSLVDARGRVWVSTAAGAAVLNRRGGGTARRRAHPLVLERLEVGGAERPLGGALRLTPKERDVAFEYSLLAFHGESLIRYRTQLAGWEDAPSAWSESTRREFTNLPRGAYVFRVWGRDSDSSVSGPVEVPFEVTETWWRRPAALAVWAILAAALGLGAIRFREGALRRRAADLEALVRLRTKELEAARDGAEAATESKSRFLAHMSHEVRTPLNAILGYAEMLAEDLSERGATDLLPDLDRIRRAARQQLVLVSEALDLGKIEAGKAELHLTEFDAGSLVRETGETAWPLVKKGHNRLETSGLEGLGTVLSDEGKLRQVLLNILSNAARFTEKGTIRVDASRTDEVLTLRVSDTGVGMTPEQLQRIFTPYAQAGAGTSARYGGTGLGLVISRGYCEVMRGSLDVESEVGKGSTFTIRVPVRLERRASSR